MSDDAKFILGFGYSRRYGEALPNRDSRAGVKHSDPRRYKRASPDALRDREGLVAPYGRLQAEGQRAVLPDQRVACGARWTAR